MANPLTHRHIATSPYRHITRPLACARGSDRAFTLVEMVVVIAIIILLTGLVVPAATQMWRDRKIADAQNVITGMLKTARARAIQSGGAETGLFFFIDGEGVQRVVPITQDPNDPAQTDQARIIKGWESDGRWHNVFSVIRDRSFVLQAPMRVVPVYAVCPETGGVGACAVGEFPFHRFSEDELKNSDFAAVAISGTTHVAQAHRNVFTLIFAPNGEMIVGRDVLIRDVDDEAESKAEEEGKGVVTASRTKAPAGGVREFYQNDNGNTRGDFNGSGAVRWIAGAPADYPPTWLLTDTPGVAMNFPSVDGLLVYDDSLFNEAGDVIGDKRKYLMNAGLPFYINRITGAVVRGPTGEAPPATP